MLGEVRNVVIVETEERQVRLRRDVVGRLQRELGLLGAGRTDPGGPVADPQDLRAWIGAPGRLPVRIRSSLGRPIDDAPRQHEIRQQRAVGIHAVSLTGRGDTSMTR